MPNDQELVLALQRGSLEALGMLYDRHQTSVYRTALAITGDVDSANDLLQDVFLRLHRFASRIDPGRPIEPWLYRMTANLAYTWVKRNHRWYQPVEDFIDWFSGGDENPAYLQVERNDDWRQIQSALAELPVQQRLVVVLFYLDDLSVQEIAEILEVPVGTVKSRLHYGRNALKQSLGFDQKIQTDWSYERI